MIDEIAGAYAGIKAAGEMAKALMNMRVSAEVQAKAMELRSALIDMQQRILDTQQSFDTLHQQNKELKETIAKFDRWEQEKERYSLTAFQTGTFVYRLKPESANGEPAHDICPRCYQDGVKSILQGFDGEIEHCKRCRGSFRLQPHHEHSGRNPYVY